MEQLRTATRQLITNPKSGSSDNKYAKNLKL